MLHNDLPNPAQYRILHVQLRTVVIRYDGGTDNRA